MWIPFSSPPLGTFWLVLKGLEPKLPEIPIPKKNNNPKILINEQQAPLPPNRIFKNNRPFKKHADTKHPRTQNSHDCPHTATKKSKPPPPDPSKAIASGIAQMTTAVMASVDHGVVAAPRHKNNKSASCPDAPRTDAQSKSSTPGQVKGDERVRTNMAMGQKPVPPVNVRIPTGID